MASYTLDELFKPITADAYKAKILAYLATKNIYTTAWYSGAPTLFMIEAFSWILAGFSSFQAQLAKMGFSGYASRSWLDVRGTYGQNLPRNLSTFATVQMRLINTSGTVQTIPSMVFENTATGKQYRFTAAGSTAPANSAFTLYATAIEAGTASTAQPGQVTRLVTTGISWINYSGVTNLFASSGGTDDETDDDYERRLDLDQFARTPLPVQDAFQSLLLGPLAISGGLPIGITRLSPVRFEPVSKEFRVYATVGGAALTTQQKADAGDMLNKYMVLPGVTAKVLDPSPIDMATAITITARKPAPATLNSQLDALTTAFFATVPIGGYRVGEAVNGNVFPDQMDPSVRAAFADYDIVSLSISVGYTGGPSYNNTTVLGPSSYPIFTPDTQWTYVWVQVN